MNIYYDKSKRELYDWVKNIFSEILNNPEKSYTTYEYWIIGVRYNDETFFEWDIRELYFLENFFRNYFNTIPMEEIDFIYVYDSKDIYMSKKLSVDIDESLAVFTRTFAKNDKYLNFMEKGDFIYDTYYQPSEQYF